MARRLLVIGCSNLKRKTQEKISAWSLYDGVVFRTLKRLERAGDFPDDLDIVIISAKYGMVQQKEKIKSYDLRMNSSLAKSQSDKIVHGLKRTLIRRKYSEVCINLGKDYLLALGTPTEWVPKFTKLTYIKGPIGKRLHDLRAWVLS
jgi:cytoplasmic iron level regulating protein YaaA (DUF328/UPF0246 family)